MTDQSVFNYTAKIIVELKQQNRIGNARSYENCLREMKVFRNKRDLSFNELNYSFLEKFETYYLRKGNSLNGLAVYMRTIRAIYNKAIKQSIASLETYPFANYTIKSEPTKKRAISMDAIQKIVALKYEPENVLFRTRNIFLMSFYLMGAPYSDLAHLKVSNIIDGRVQYKRQKTGKFYDIKITENLSEIIDYYKTNKDKDDYLLPIIKRDSLDEQYRDIMSQRRLYNKQLRRIAKDAEIDEHLTSYVSRHSFASIANNMAVPVTAISEMLGHQKLTTTQTYLASLNKEIIDDYNAKIIGG
ncbi:tyrosine-type recombinase/integrase [Saccharicrinis aurantiacus]|uniref:tyrosine-type recombinase/integrase n=1 Tax=Saccharicrinis aurantiacus TaxID=1849719 RepID=UPI002491A499|nr:site-specific integrase [Saccharicrinis aurantiacus]